MWDGFDKRKFPRLNFKCPVTLQPANSTSSIKTETVNISAGGVCVLLKKSLHKLAVCRITLKLSKTLPAIKAQGRIVWCVQTQKSGVRGKYYDTGIEFTDMDLSLVAMLASFVERKMNKKQKP